MIVFREQAELLSSVNWDTKEKNIEVPGKSLVGLKLTFGLSMYLTGSGLRQLQLESAAYSVHDHRLLSARCTQVGSESLIYAHSGCDSTGKVGSKLFMDLSLWKD